MWGSGAVWLACGRSLSSELNPESVDAVDKESQQSSLSQSELQGLLLQVLLLQLLCLQALWNWEMTDVGLCGTGRLSSSGVLPEDAKMLRLRGFLSFSSSEVPRSSCAYLEGTRAMALIREQARTY